MNLFTKLKQTHNLENKVMTIQGEMWGRGLSKKCGTNINT